MAPITRRRPAVKKEEDNLNAEFVASRYSNQELEFLIAHFGEAPEVALGEDELPIGVNEAAVKPILDRTYRLEVLQLHMQEQAGDPTRRIWCGFDALRDVCQRMLEWNAVVADLERRTAGSDGPVRRAAGAPSLHMWDPDTDIPYPGGVGADCEFVRTAIDGGKRVPLYVMLRETGIGAIKELQGVAQLLKGRKKAIPAAPASDDNPSMLDSTPNALTYNQGTTTSTVECPICGHTEVYQTDKPSTKRTAEQRMRKHLDASKLKKDQHHILAQRLASGKAGTGATKQTMDDLVGAGVAAE